MRHLVAFGGWNGPHPDEKLNGKEWFEVWRAWNVAHGFVFDGCDWDLEGNDDASQNLSEGMVALVADFAGRRSNMGISSRSRPRSRTSTRVLPRSTCC